jgi:fatty acid desaturase
MDHQSLVASLPPEQRKQLTATSDAAGLLHLALHLGAIALCGTLITAAVPGWWALVPVQGVLLVFLFTLEHETVHLTPFRSRWLNLAAGWLAAMVLALPWNWFRYFHFAHHRHTQDPDRDPELASPKPETIWQFIRHVSGLPVWWSHLATLMRNAAGANRDDFVPARGQAKVMREARVMLAGYAGLAAASWMAGSAVLVWVWLVPVLLGQPVLRVYLLAEHGRCPLVANMLENSRTTFTNRIVRFVAWNMPYHAEHHAYPAVPFHKLPALHQVTRDHLGVTHDGYANFAKDYASSLGPTAS